MTKLHRVGLFLRKLVFVAIAEFVISYVIMLVYTAAHVDQRAGFDFISSLSDSWIAWPAIFINLLSSPATTQLSAAFKLVVAIALTFGVCWVMAIKGLWVEQRLWPSTETPQRTLARRAAWWAAAMTTAFVLIFATVIYTSL